MSDITQILDAVGRGDAKPADELLPLVYEELRKLAAARMANEAAGHTLQPTALVHEAWLRLAGNDPTVQFANRAHFFAAAAEIAKLRFFGGLTLEEAGHVLGVTDRTAKRYWAYARAWLFDEMRQTLGR